MCLPLAYIEVLNRDTAPSEETPPPRVPSVGPHKEYITYLVRDASGRVLLQSHDADPAAFSNILQPGFHDSSQLRLYTERAVQGTFFVTAADPGAIAKGRSLKRCGCLHGRLRFCFPSALSASGPWSATHCAPCWFSR